MDEGSFGRNLGVGSELSGPVRVMTDERIRWYSTSQRSSAAGEIRPVAFNIHTSDEYARKQGLAGAVADGMILTNWCQTMLLRYFGLAYVERGELRTKFIKPAFIGDTVFVRGRVRSVEGSPHGGTVYALDVWCDNQHGVKITDGDATIGVGAR